MLAEQKLHGVLDLGASSTENARFLARFSKDVFIHDLFRSARGEAGARSTAFNFDSSAADLLPEGMAKFDLIFLWDLLQFFDRASFQPFSQRLTELCRPGCLVFLLAANHAPQPLTPIHFKILDEKTLDYTVPPGELGESPRLTTREVERRMDLYKPIRLFQLRNGMQEFIFRYEPRAGEGASPPEGQTKG
jgi:SAM-dependent methyltransferase